MTDLAPGQVVWLSLDPARGREQGGHRPALVVASSRYLDVVDTLAIVVPITSVERHWPNHVPVAGPTGLDRLSWAMTEQVRTVTRDRIGRVAGSAAPETMAEVRRWLSDSLDLG